MTDQQSDVRTGPATARRGSLVVTDPQLLTATSAPAHFRFGEVTSTDKVNPAVLATLAPDLGALADFAGNWTGTGFNTIFRPNSTETPTELPGGPAQGDNVLELNLTQETLSFSPSLGSVPNRGMVQGDTFLNGVPYLQTISDVTVAGQSIGIHVEPGLWMAVQPTTDPAEGSTYARMASIPHGTTVAAQGTSRTFPGPPTIPAADITPRLLGNGAPFRFASQTAATPDTPRIPQDLTAWIGAGTITQAMLDDPNSVLRDRIAAQTILETTELSVSTQPGAPLFGGGTDNIAFLLGDAAAANPNADAALMSATFWIETVEHVLHLPVFHPGQPPLRLPLHSGLAHTHVIVNPPHPIPTPRPIRFTTKQIQYSQLVILNFNGLAWPHVSVATLTPAGPIVVPPGAWN
jgi:hypothetical protein